VVIDGFTVTVASVGDSRCILDTQGGELQLLTVDHRLEENAEERERVTASGGEVGRLNLFGGQEVNQFNSSQLVTSLSSINRTSILLMHCCMFFWEIRLVLSGAGLVACAFQDPLGTWMLGSTLCPFHMSSKSRLI
jgi:hypothetical protein